jgi:hypothetical protein
VTLRPHFSAVSPDVPRAILVLSHYHRILKFGPFPLIFLLVKINPTQTVRLQAFKLLQLTVLLLGKILNQLLCFQHVRSIIIIFNVLQLIVEERGDVRLLKVSHHCLAFLHQASNCALLHFAGRLKRFHTHAFIEGFLGNLVKAETYLAPLFIKKNVHLQGRVALY